MMTVKELIGVLQKADPECAVYMDSDDARQVFNIESVYCGVFSCYLSDRIPGDGELYHETRERILGFAGAVEELERKSGLITYSDLEE